MFNLANGKNNLTIPIAALPLVVYPFVCILEMIVQQHWLGAADILQMLVMVALAVGLVLVTTLKVTQLRPVITIALALIAVLQLFSILGSIITIFSNISNLHYLGFSWVLSMLFGIFCTFISLLAYVILAAQTLGLWANFKMPILYKYWFAPALLLALNVIRAFFGTVSSLFSIGFSKYFFADLLWLIGALLIVVAFGLVAMWSKKMFDEQEQESVAHCCDCEECHHE